jgi:hypothetical protein
MARPADCHPTSRVEWFPAMHDFADLERRIDGLCARASAAERDARLLVEIEDLLAEGYVCALHGDRRSRRLQMRLDALLEASASASELQRLAGEQRMVADATRRLREQLAVMREHWVALGSERLGLV